MLGHDGVWLCWLLDFLFLWVKKKCLVRIWILLSFRPLPTGAARPRGGGCELQDQRLLLRRSRLAWSLFMGV